MNMQRILFIYFTTYISGFDASRQNCEDKQYGGEIRRLRLSKKSSENWAFLH